MDERITAQQEFDGYIRKVYPDPPLPGEDQYEQLRDAFFGGCHIGLLHERCGNSLAVELIRFVEAKRKAVGDKP